MTNWALLSGAATFWDGIDAIQDAYAWAGDQLNQLFDVASGWLEQAGIWSEQIFGFNGIELAVPSWRECSTSDKRFTIL